MPVLLFIYGLGCAMIGAGVMMNMAVTIRGTPVEDKTYTKPKVKKPKR